MKIIHGTVRLAKYNSADLSMCVYIGKNYGMYIYQHNLAQSVLANNEANIPDSIDAYS